MWPKNHLIGGNDLLLGQGRRRVRARYISFPSLHIFGESEQ